MQPPRYTIFQAQLEPRSTSAVGAQRTSAPDFPPVRPTHFFGRSRGADNGSLFFERQTPLPEPRERRLHQPRLDRDPGRRPEPRSEEHTSELQSLMRLSYAVFCLKKKKKHNTRT